MPKGSGDGDAMTRLMSRKEGLKAKLAAAERRCRRTKAAARRAADKCRAPMRMFLEAYYIEAQSAGEACSYARIDRRTGERYRAEINRI